MNDSSFEVYSISVIINIFYYWNWIIFGEIFEILQIFKIEPHPIGIKLIPTQIMENLNIQHFHPKTRMLWCTCNMVCKFSESLQSINFLAANKKKYGWFYLFTFFFAIYIGIIFLIGIGQILKISNISKMLPIWLNFFL